MTWLLFAFPGPAAWAVSVHLDKYLVERYFKQVDVGSLMALAALFALFALAVIWWAHPEMSEWPDHDRRHPRQRLAHVPAK